MKIEIGMPYRFRPAAFTGSREDGVWTPPELTGRVIYINREHGFFTVEAVAHGNRLRESFKGALATRLASRCKLRRGYKH